MLRVRYVCWRVNVLVVITSLQHTVFSPDKRWVHFPFLEGILNFLTLFSISGPQITSSRFFFHLKAVIECSWNNSRRFLLFWRMLQLLQPTAARFGKNRLHIHINGMRFEFCCSRSLSCSRLSLTSLSTFSDGLSTSFWS